MQIRPLEYRVHMALLAAIGLAGLFSTTRLNNTIAQWNTQRDGTRDHQAAIAEIEKQAAIAQAHIDNRVDQYDSVTLTGYICNPEQAPFFDATAFTQPELMNVSDRNGRIVGQLQSGVFMFTPGNCN